MTSESEAHRIFVDRLLRRNGTEEWKTPSRNSPAHCIRRQLHFVAERAADPHPTSSWIFHGATLEAARAILHTGFRVGPATHCIRRQLRARALQARVVRAR